jgi:uracil DNA glycosylase
MCLKLRIRHHFLHTTAFLDQNPFQKLIKFLEKEGLKPINWQIED